ncbi:DUF308 domain-containing protein [Candidatus Saccharibacteria bacterium]|nr:DUF308 domain-containing protein [Candidatus Saccharibacteria bacterium]
MSKVEIIKHPVEKVGWSLKKSAWSAAIESLIVMIFGIFLVTWPDVTVLVISNVLGAIFIIAGIYKIINYFVAKGQEDFFNNDLLSGVLALLVGIAAIIIGEDIANIFRIVIGIWMIYESLVRVNTAIKLQSAGIKVWSYILIIALIMLALGIFVTFNNGAIMQLIGWMLILTGIIGIVGDAMLIQQINVVVDKLTKK